MRKPNDPDVMRKARRTYTDNLTSEGWKKVSIWMSPETMSRLKALSVKTNMPYELVILRALREAEGQAAQQYCSNPPNP